MNDIARAFTLHRAAMAREVRGLPFVDAYRAALAAFGKALAGDDFATRLEAIISARAALLVDTDAAELAATLIAKLPRWLLDLHFERARRAFAARDDAAVARHWRILTAADGLAARGDAPSVEGYQRMFAETFLDEGAIEREPESCRQVADAAERMLRADPANRIARRILRAALATELLLGLDRLAARGPSIDRLDRRRHRRLSRRLRRTARRFERQLRMSRRSLDEAEHRVVARDLTALARFHAYNGEIEAALKHIRRARRLDPGRDERERLFRQLRKARRR